MERFSFAFIDCFCDISIFASQASRVQLYVNLDATRCCRVNCPYLRVICNW